MKHTTFFLFLFLLFSESIWSQCANPVTMTERSSIAYNFPFQAMTVEHDQNNQPFIYVAGKEQGLLVYDISNVNTPFLNSTFPVSQFSDLEVMSLTQEGNFLYLALGNYFASVGESSGMAIIDVTDPSMPVARGLYVLPQSNRGAGIVQIVGNRAYLGAMGHGLVVLDILDKDNITFVSQFVPSIDFPNPTNPDPAKYNARGMAVANNKVYLAYDAGGLHIIDVSDDANPTELGNYSNALLNNFPRAYNNLVLDGNLAYVAIDYCGMEVLDISDPANIAQVGWWNPWNCHTNPLNWFTSDGHTNEVRFDPVCKMIFMSTGKTEVVAVDVADPSHPTACGEFGDIDSDQGVWGIGLHEQRLFAAYIHVPLGIPFFSNFGGVKILDWSNECSTGLEEAHQQASFSIFPNPTSGAVTIDFESEGSTPLLVNVYDVLGALKHQQSWLKGATNILQLTTLSPGIYWVQVVSRGQKWQQRLVIVAP